MKIIMLKLSLKNKFNNTFFLWMPIILMTKKDLCTRHEIIKALSPWIGGTWNHMVMENLCMVDKYEMNSLLYPTDTNRIHLYVHYLNLVDHNNNPDISVRVFGQYCYGSKITKSSTMKIINAYLIKISYILLYYIIID